MAIYERESLVRAPLDEVWAFHSAIDGLVALTPGWFGLRVEGVTGPDGTADPPELLEGTTIDLSVRPLGIGPRQRTTSLIEERRREDGFALFRDRMIEGPFEEWLHTHAFEAVDGGTLVRDRVEYRLPYGLPGRVAARGMVVGFAPMFRHRHRRTRALLED
jgi:ligand-binding SRPBCC domain-containing protein